MTTSKVSVWLSIGVVALCLGLGGWFVWWYVKPGTSSTVVFTPQDLAAMQNGGRTGNGGNNPPVPRALRIAPAAPLRPPPEPDGIYGTADVPVIRAGPVQVRVGAATRAGDPPAIVFRQRIWGMLQDNPSFTIARRIVHEPAVAKQLAVTDDQLAKLTPIVASPALSSKYMTALPVPADDLAKVAAAWTAYTAALSGADKAVPDKLKTDLLTLVRTIGSASMARAKQEYIDANGAIGQILEPRQINAYKQGLTLGP